MPSSTLQRVVHAAAICAATLTLSSCVGEDTTPTSTRYQTALKRVFDQYHLVGVQASVRKPGEEEWRQSLGYADLASATPFAPDSHSPIRSITKSMTVTVILQLVRDHVIALDDKLEQFIPGIPNGAAITIADLAGMTSGIADYSTSDAFRTIFGGDLQHVFTEVELVDFAIPLSPVFTPPGSAYQYSNTNTVLLGMIVEQKTGQALDVALQQRIFTPLGMTGSSYPYVVAVPDPHPTPYDIGVPSGVTEVLPLISPTSLAGAGAAVSTLDDLQTWGLALGDGRLIGAGLQAERVNRSTAVTNGPEYDRYGLGIGILKGWIGHTGSGVGWQVATLYDPKTGATIAVVVNATPDGGRPNLNFAQEVFEALANVVRSD